MGVGKMGVGEQVPIPTMERGPLIVTMDTLATSRKHPTSLLLATEAPPAYC